MNSSSLDTVLPNVFVKSGSYSNGVIHLNLVNRTQETSVKFVGNIAETEVSNHTQVSNTFSLSGDYNEVLSIETGVLFDIGFSLETGSSPQKDALYLADGPWGLDYLDDYVTVTHFNVSTSDREYKDDFYEVDRSVNAVGEVKGNVNLFRHILPGDQTLDVADYDFINFNIKNNEPVEVVIMPEDDREWQNRLRYTIPVNTEAREISLSFSDFLDKNGNSTEIVNIKTVVFSIIGDYTNYKPFSINVNNLSFSTNNVLAVDNYNLEETTKMFNYPNPFTSSTTIQLASESENVKIEVYDVIGRIVDLQKIKTNNSIKVQYNAPLLKTGIYKYRLTDDNNKKHSGTFIIK
ncbi:MAG: T9SS type A sorting domain-containing protein [Polaribacter sp.]|uniref:T9SS type A sorting domain-containing protein n=1 Tax=Polaribacter sp. TaxID=1920175 RepID=UPI003263B54D